MFTKRELWFLGALAVVWVSVIFVSSLVLLGVLFDGS